MATTVRTLRRTIAVTSVLLLTAGLAAAHAGPDPRTPVFSAPWNCDEIRWSSTYASSGSHGRGALDFNDHKRPEEGGAVLASAAGNVRRSYSDGYGHYVTVTHVNGWSTLYAHLRERPTIHDRNPDQQGVQVWRGDRIGRVGNSGTNSTGAHLHYEQRYQNSVQPVLFETKSVPAGTSATSSDPTVRSANCGHGHPREMTSGRWVLTDSLAPDRDRDNRVRMSYAGVSYLPVVGDWDGDGRDTAGVFQPSTGRWVLINSHQPDGAPRTRFTFGGPTYLPVVGDWDGDGRDTAGVFQPSTGRWVLINSHQPDGAPRTRFAFGNSSYIPVAGNWDGYPGDNPGLFQPSTGRWVLTNSLAPDHDRNNRDRFTFGSSSYLPVVGDWDGDGRDTAGVFKPSTGRWVLINSHKPDGAPRTRFIFGSAPYIPVAGNWDGYPGDNPGVVR